MFKLLRDSIFSPKKIIHYRAKKVWFVILYMLLVSSIMGITMLAKVYGTDKLDYVEKKELVEVFKKYNAYTKDGVFYSSDSFIETIYNYEIGFIGTDKDVNDLKTTPTFVVSGDSISMYVNAGLSQSLYKISTISELSSDFENVELYNITANDEFFDSLENLLTGVKPGYMIMSFFSGIFYGIIYMLGYAVITYLFLMVMFKAGKYMKKGQLFKMLIFASTLVVVCESICILLNFGQILSFLVLIISFIPLYVLEREFAMRIRMKEIGEKALNNQSVIDKINEALGRNTNKNDDEDDDNKE